MNIRREQLGRDNIVLYVDTNGNDKALGTSDDPLATLGEALKRIPSNSYAYIYLTANQTHIFRYNIDDYAGRYFINNSVVSIKSNIDDQYPVIEVEAFQSDTNTYFASISLTGRCSIWLGYLDIRLPEALDSTLPISSTFHSCFIRPYYNCFSCIDVFRSKINLGSSGANFCGSGYSIYQGLIILLTESTDTFPTTITTNSSGYFYWVQGVGYIEWDGVVDDTTHLVYGLVKDASGKVRNLRSTWVL